MAERPRPPLAVVVAGCVIAMAVLAALQVFSVRAPQEAPQLYPVMLADTGARLVGAIGIGAALGVAGVLLQTASANPLADPEITGVNSGAAFGAVLVTLLAGRGIGVVPGALTGAAVAAAVVLTVGLRGSAAQARQRLILLGVALAAMFSAWTAVVLVLDEAQLSTVLSWLAGSLGGIRWWQAALAVAGAVLVGGAALLMHRALDLLAAGDAVTASVGMVADRARRWTVAGAVILVGLCVGAAGPIGFLSLLAATLARGVAGPRQARVLPLAAVLGATVLLIADATAQRLFAPAETPVGVLTALVGMPLLIWRIRQTVVVRV